ncbi:efflux RND transporter periplasmic adaptor subunit [Thalassotalea mangrovi]|uniref:Efflux RND transporter periplasmic adaptor subunit n=1 Tax=Thalassotalea mangrovi TaxID=2572245 RepID=A0A4U1B2P6_9GAMM|nr:efflux RND transporter periplasmic adaptor subunit [Thalassotalea mangrovi]TKB43924.1 efflux RND transporter periplasmic adaptor subunit [Thalassotalea mangrovi]
MRFSCVALVLTISVLAAGCEKKQQEVKQAPPPEVGVMEIKLEKLNMSHRYAAKTASLSSVEIYPEVSGRIVERFVVEGQEVKRGDKLFKIDDEPFKAEVARQKGAVARALAAVELAKTRYDMSLALAEEEVLSKLDTKRVKVEYDQAKAALATANAALQAAEVQLLKTDVVSPIDGMAGITKVKRGDMVDPDLGWMIEIIANDAIEVYSQVGAQRHFDIVSKLKGTKAEKISVIELELPNGDIYEHEGKLDYIGHEVSESSNTVTYRVVFPNPDGVLLGGQNVTLIATDRKSTKSITIPQKAVQEDQVGRYVMAVDDDNVASKKHLKLGDRVGTDWIVEEGLEEGDRIIVSGILRAKEGQPVTPVAE